jgi:Ni/Co efflux regulator RcnB
MKKLLSMLIAATFAAVSFQALAAETKSETPRMEKKATKATKATKAKKHIVKKHSKKIAKKEVKQEEMKK